MIIFLASLLTRSHSCGSYCISCGGTVCNACNPSLNRLLIMGSCVCSNHAYDNGGTCVQCVTNCATCSGSPAFCTTCYINQYLHPVHHTCIHVCFSFSEYLIVPHPPCLTSFMYSSYDASYFSSCPVCSPCSSNCLICQTSSTHCRACNNPLWLDMSSNVCAATCPDGQFIPSAANTYRECMYCNSSICRNCINNPNNCLSCANPKVFNPNTNTCDNACPTNMFEISPGLCSACDANCLTCSTTSTHCLTCAAGQYLTPADVCVTSCPNGQTINTNTNINCIYCTVSLCKTCSMTQCLQCYAPHLVDSTNSCVDPCPIGEYKNSPTTCALCPSYCDVCSSAGCLFCKGGFFSHSGGICYNCFCPDCSKTCSNGACAANLFYYEYYCYSKCIETTFSAPGSSTCKKCVQPCLACSSQSSCLSCQAGLVLEGSSCIGECKRYYYSENSVCESCVQTSSYKNQISSCYEDRPVLQIKPSCANPFSSHYRISLKAQTKFKAISSSQFSIAFTIDGRDVSTCFSYMFSEVDLIQLHFTIFTLNCTFSQVVIEIKVTGLVSNDNNVPFKQFTGNVAWPLSVKDYQTVSTAPFYQLIKQFQNVQYANYFPLLVFIFPQFLLLQSLILLTTYIPMQNYAMVALFSSQQLKPNCYLQATLLPQPLQSRFMNKTVNSFGQPIGRLSLSRFFFINFMVAWCWIVFSWLLFFVQKLISQYSLHDYVKLARFRIHNAFHLLLAVGFVQAMRNQPFKNRLASISSALSIMTLVYYILFWAFQVSSLYSMSVKDRQRFQQLGHQLFATKKIKWFSQQNKNYCAFHILDPIYSRIIGVVFQFILFCALEAARMNPLAQLISLMCFCGVNLVRIALKPPQLPNYLNAISMAKLFILMCYGAAQLGTDLYFKKNIHKTLQRHLLEQRAFVLWSWLGWLLSLLFLLLVFLSIVEELACWCTKDEVPQLQLDDDQMTEIDRYNVRQDISIANETGRTMSEVSSGQYQIQKISVVKDGRFYLLKIVSVTELSSDPTKTYLTKMNGLFVRVISSFMRVSCEDKIYADLSRISAQYRSDKFVLKTIGYYKFSQKQCTAEALHYFNQVIAVCNQTGNHHRVLLRGDNQLSWTPLQPRAL